MTNQYGPGPIIHGRDIEHPDRFIVQVRGRGVQTYTQAEIAALPIAPQWFSGTANGLLATWWSRDVAEQHAQQLGVVWGQIAPYAYDAHSIPVLCDPYGKPLRCDA